MKKEYSSRPETAKHSEYGFSWIDFVTAIPSPLFVVTTYKSNGLPNACMQSWATFVGDDAHFYCIMAFVSKGKHMYESIKETGELVINFPSADCIDRCMKTIENNKFDDDEITLSGLTAEKATTVNAPRIKECFLNLECEYLWEKEIVDGDRHVVMCAVVKNVCMDAAHFDEKSLGRYGETGYLYNIHSPMNPETGEAEADSFGVLKKL